jgi:hypothetical protein
MMDWIALGRNTLIRRLTWALLPVASWLFKFRLYRRIHAYDRNQARLRQRYAIGSSTPIHGYDDFIERQIDAYAAASPAPHFATTSGTMGKPKKLFYNDERLLKYRADAISCTVRAMHRYQVRNPALFVLSSYKVDDSFSSLVLNDAAKTDYLTGLLEPARYLFQPAMLRYIDVYGASAVRLWLAVIANPGVLYATNPSTVAGFLSDTTNQWIETTAMIRDFHRDQYAFAEIIPIVRRIASPGYTQRMRSVCESERPLELKQFWPGLSAWSSWDGGYVEPYIRQVKTFLKPDEFKHIPVFSMSTEAVETLTFFANDGAICFLPIAPDIVYEFLPEEKPDQPAELLDARELEKNATYSMVVSDCYGLKRYQTEDVFICCGHVHGLPDLRFLRRRGLSFSYTGEKISGNQLSQAYREVARQVNELSEMNAQLCCFPGAQDCTLPYYQLVVVMPPGSTEIVVSADHIVLAFENALTAVNQEFAQKRQSGRLGPTRIEFINYDRMATLLDRRTQSNGDITRRSWESQFKLAPLYLMPWDQLGTAAQGSAARRT